LIILYNQLGEQKPELGRLIVKGNLTNPAVVLLVPDKAAAEAPRIKVKAFSIHGINEAARGKLLKDIEGAKDEAMNYAYSTRLSSIRGLEGTVAIHNDTNLLVATGTEAFIEMVDSIVTATQAREHDRPSPGAPSEPAK
jgi:hypothetical protein